MLKRCAHSAIICLKSSAAFRVGLRAVDVGKKTYAEDDADGVLRERNDDYRSRAGAVQSGEVDDLDSGFQCEGRHID